MNSKEELKDIFGILVNLERLSGIHDEQDNKKQKFDVVEKDLDLLEEYRNNSTHFSNTSLIEIYLMSFQKVFVTVKTLSSPSCTQQVVQCESSDSSISFAFCLASSRLAHSTYDFLQ